MATQITWIIEWMNVKPTESSLTDVVITAGWRCNGVFADTYGTVYGTCGFNQPGDPFTPYAQLTEQQVLGWCWANGVNKDATEAAVDQQIKDQIAPPVITPPLPWSQA